MALEEFIRVAAAERIVVREKRRVDETEEAP
jgi:hypothetical protein